MPFVTPIELLLGSCCPDPQIWTAPNSSKAVNLQHWTQITEVQISIPPFAFKSLGLSQSSFPHLENGYNNSNASHLDIPNAANIPPPKTSSGEERELWKDSGNPDGNETRQIFILFVSLYLFLSFFLSLCYTSHVAKWFSSSSLYTLNKYRIYSTEIGSLLHSGLQSDFAYLSPETSALLTILLHHSWTAPHSAVT